MIFIKYYLIHIKILILKKNDILTISKIKNYNIKLRNKRIKIRITKVISRYDFNFIKV